MKLYYHPASTSCRPAMLYAAEAGIPLDYQLVDIFTGEQYGKPFESVNPNHLIPVLEDGSFRLTEVSAILKYLADKTGSPGYPKDLQQRARVNERMDWFNTQFYRDWGYGLIYPQLFPHLKRPSDEQQKGVVAWGKERSKGWLKILDQNLIGSRNAYVCGDQVTLADYLGAAYVTAGEAVRCQFSDYPNVSRWLANMKKGKNWEKVNKPFYDLAASLKGMALEAI